MKDTICAPKLAAKPRQFSSPHWTEKKSWRKKQTVNMHHAWESSTHLTFAAEAAKELATWYGLLVFIKLTNLILLYIYVYLYVYDESRNPKIRSGVRGGNV